VIPNRLQTFDCAVGRAIGRANGCAFARVFTRAFARVFTRASTLAAARVFADYAESLYYLRGCPLRPTFPEGESAIGSRCVTQRGFVQR